MLSFLLCLAGLMVAVLGFQIYRYYATRL